MKDAIKAVILDIDGTLSTEVSWLQLTKSLGASHEEHLRIFNQFTKNEIDYITAKKLLINLWRSTQKANKKSITQIFYSWKLKDDAFDVVEYLKTKYKVCLMSGSVDLYVRGIAEKLGVSDWYANTELVFDENDNLVDFHYFRDQAKKKLEHLNEYLIKSNLSKEVCVIIGNGDSDVILFRELPYGIAVDTDLHEGVKILANRTISNLSEIKTIL
ncbi:MAG: HAD-IB family phosphatase [Candidatus Yonathbacteria bacterium]|nr:HAD-IB family phosphatase [Candidatus Yonathbacteria bacterium]